MGLIVSFPAAAHHGKDFLVVESYEIPHPGDLYALASGDYGRNSGDESMELEPSLLVGALPALAAEVHAHFVKDDGSASFEYEALAPALHMQLTDQHSASPISVGASFEYEIGGGDVPDALEGRVILEKSIDRLKVSANGIARHIRSVETEFGYAAGARFELNDTLGIGAEVQGSFDSGLAEGLLGVYLEPSERFTIKLGAGTSLVSDGADVTVRAGVVYRY